jgi:hypothetical protein
MSEAKGSGVKLDANTTAQASQLEREYFLRLAQDLVRPTPKRLGNCQILRKAVKMAKRRSILSS